MILMLVNNVGTDADGGDVSDVGKDSDLGKGSDGDDGEALV